VLTAASNGFLTEAKHVREELGLNFLQCLARQGNNEPLAGRIRSLWDEYKQGSTHISKVVHQVDKLEALQQAYLYTICYPTHNLSDFKSHRGQIIDPWLAQQADKILCRWDALDLRTKSSLIMVFVIGGPGVGKGTQCALAAARFGFKHISVGKLLREEESSPESFFKDFIRDSIRQSVVVPAALTIMLLEKKIQSAQERGKAGVLVDGFPRSSEQPRAFQEQVCSPILHGNTPNCHQITSRFATIVIDCPDNVLSQRLSRRAGTSKREDDEEHIIQKRPKPSESRKRESSKFCPGIGSGG
jgi:UMP-CMP kinase